MSRLQKYVFRLIGLFFFLIFLLSATQKTQAQTHKFAHYGVDQGLLSSRTSWMLQDSFGNIIVSISAGLQIFDGYRFSTSRKRYNLHDAEWVWQMKNREDGIWTLGQSPTVYRINGSKKRAHPANFELWSHYGSRNQSSFQIKEGDTVNIGYSINSFYLQLLPDSTVKKIPLDSLLKVPCAYVMDADDKNNELFGIYFPEGPRGKFEKLWIGGHYYKIPPQNSKRRMWVKSVTDSSMAISLGKHVFLVNRKSKKLLSVQKLSSDILSLESDHSGGIWIGLRQGIVQFNSTLDSVLFEDDQLRFVCAIMEDRERHMWFGSVKGIHKLLSPHITNFSHVDGELITTEKVPLLSNVGGMTFALSEKKLYQLSDGKPKNLVSFSDFGIRVDALSKGDGTTLYLADPRGIFKYNKGNVTKILPKVNTRDFIATEPDNSFWIAHFASFRKYDSTGALLFDSRSLPDSLQADVKRTSTRILCSDHNGGVWMVYNRKLTHFSNGQMREFSSVSGHENLPGSLDFQVIADNLWVITPGFGVHILNGDSLYNISTQDGLATNHCISMAKESDSTVWVSSTRGVNHITYRFVGKEMRTHIEYFNADNGLPSSSTYSLATRNGSLWISNRDGFSRLDAKSLFSNRIMSNPNIRITNVWVNDSRQSIKESINLKYDENRVSISLKGISFESLSPPGYEYRLLGSDSSWQFTVDTVVSLGPLASGDYTFQARTVTKRGLISEEPSTLTLHIAPPYWQTWWFITLMVILTQGIVISLILVYARLRRKALLSDKRSLEAELRAIRSQINPHFMFNALNNLQERLQGSENELSSKHLNSFAELMRKVLWASRERRISVKDEMEITRMYLGFSTGHYRGKVSYSFEISDEVKSQDEILQLPPLITQPLVENAVLHGAAKSQHELGVVKMKVGIENSHIVIDISDNGPGFTDNKKANNSDKSKESVGSKLIMEHIDLLNQGSRQKIKYEVKRIQNETHVILIIPIDI